MLSSSDILALVFGLVGTIIGIGTILVTIQRRAARNNNLSNEPDNPELALLTSIPTSTPPPTTATGESTCDSEQDFADSTTLWAEDSTFPSSNTSLPAPTEDSTRINRALSDLLEASARLLRVHS